MEPGKERSASGMSSIGRSGWVGLVWASSSSREGRSPVSI